MRRKVVNIVFGFVAGIVFLASFAFFWWWRNHDVEQPSYRVEEAEGPIEIRTYGKLVVAEVERTGARWTAVNEGFMPLARYIFGSDRPGEKIAMTAPVTQQPVETSAGSRPTSWQVRFIMPSKHDLETLPRPANGDVRLRELSGGRMAAIRFSGIATDERVADHEKKLFAWLEERGLQASALPTYAYYNDPFTPGFLRRNEILVPVKGPVTSRSTAPSR
ncbi:MAG: heme-binding protein [Myxococcales bacterium]|nr:heme-binding protein [Myxococcales bacterium]